MADDLRKAWNDVASHWDDWGSPLRPCAEDLHRMRDALQRWLAKNPVERLQVFLCGVTPEIVTMSWPCPIELISMDQAQRMIDVVWPGDVPGVRRAVAGNWLNSGLPAGSQDVIINDGGFVFFDYPDGLRGLFAALRKLLRPGGLFIGRDFAQVSPRESLSQVIDAALGGRIGNFHIFKWRLAMSLQVGRNEGIRHHDIWQAWKDSGIDPTRLPQPGWSERAVGTIEFYRDSQARLRFPTLEEFRTVLAEEFENIEVTYPGYELGERCPVVTAQPKNSDTVSG